MREIQTTQYSGISGRVLRSCLSISTLASGISLGLVMLAGHYLLARIGHLKIAALYDQCVVTVALGRYAVNGLAGEFRGTVFSMAGGSWNRALMVAARYGALCLSWIVPLGLLAMTPDELRLAIFALISGQSSARLLGLVFVIVAGILVSPPLFLISAVGAEGFGDLIRPGHWARLFSGRRTDLYAMYAIFTGALCVQIALAMPIALLAFTQGADFGIAASALLLAFIGGLTVSLLGRLCGFFALGESGDVPAHVDAELVPATSVLLAPHFTLPRSVDAALASAAASVAGAGPALTDAPARMEAIQRRAANDPPGALAELQELRASHAPHPHVLKTLCLLLSKASRQEEAVAAAKEALPICFARGYAPMAAEIVKALWVQRDQLELSHDQLAAVASALHKGGDNGSAIRVYGALVSMDPKDLRGIKGLMQIAEELLRGGADPRQAVTIYSFLLKHCAGSPLAEHMREGLAAAQSRQAKQAAAG